MPSRITTDIKEKMGTLDYAWEDKYYTLPDKETILIPSDVQNKIPQILFNPKEFEFGKIDGLGVHELVSTAINLSDIDIRR